MRESRMIHRVGALVGGLALAASVVFTGHGSAQAYTSTRATAHVQLSASWGVDGALNYDQKVNRPDGVAVHATYMSVSSSGQLGSPEGYEYFGLKASGTDVDYVSSIVNMWATGTGMTYSSGKWHGRINLYQWIWLTHVDMDDLYASNLGARAPSGIGGSDGFG